MVCMEVSRHLTSEVLCERSREETARHLRGESRPDGASFELFRRAIVEGDDACWQGLLAVYHGLVLSWCLRAGALPSDGDEMAAATWVKFWQSFSAGKLARAGGSTRAVLGYLKLCAHSVVLDDLRRRSRLVSLEERQREIDGRDDRAPEIEGERVDAAALWDLVQTHLRDDRERLLVTLTYEMNLRPAEIQRRYPAQFPSVRDVYRITRNILDRLRNSRRLAAWVSAP